VPPLCSKSAETHSPEPWAAETNKVPYQSREQSLYQQAEKRMPFMLPIRPAYQTSSRPGNAYLAAPAAIFVLGITVPAIHRTVFPRPERDFALLLAIRTDSLMHLSRTSIVSSIFKRHIDSPVFIDTDCWLCKEHDNYLIAYSRSFRLNGNCLFLGLGPRLFSPGRCS